MCNVGIFAFDDMEFLDFAGPYEVFSVASELSGRAFFHVFTVTQDKKGIKTVNGLSLLPDFGFADHPPIDILILPGGVGTKAEMEKEEVLGWVFQNHKNSALTLSVCSGARLPGKLGLLDGLEYTTHHEVMEQMQKIAPEGLLQRDKRFVGSGKLFTSAGISAGIDLSLHIVEKLCGRKTADKTRIYMEYGDWEGLQT